MKMRTSLFMAALLMVAGAASAKIVVIQAEDAVVLGANYAVVADTNVPPYAFETDYITPLTTDTGPIVESMAFYDVGNLTSNSLYDLYMRFHVGTNGYSDDSIFINSDGFGTNSLNFSFQNGIAGRTGLDGQNCASPGFHWIKMNGTGDLGFLEPFNSGDGINLSFAIAAREDGLDVDALAFAPANVAITDEMLNPTNSAVALWAVGGIPATDVGDSTPLIEAYFLDGAETADINAITMTIDGNVVNDYSTTYSNFVTTVSYTPTGGLALNETHTTRVVVASSPEGVLVTNEFSFYVGNPIGYVAVTTTNTIMSTSINGPVGIGTEWVTTTEDAADGLWRFRDAFGIPVTVTNEPSVDDYQAYSGLGNVYESNNDDCPRLKTTAYVEEAGVYQVYVYYNGNEGWNLRAGLEDTPGINSLELFDSGNSTLLFTYDGGFFTHQFYRANIGTVIIADINTPIAVYQEDAPAEGGRTWVEGIGIQKLVDGTPTVDPDIQSISVADGMATLTWNSEVTVTYTILHKTNVQQDATWTPVKTGIGGGNPTATDSVPLSGADTEFFRIEGN